DGAGSAISGIDLVPGIESQRGNLAKVVCGGWGPSRALNDTVLPEPKKRLAIGSPKGSIRAGLHTEQPTGESAVVVTGLDLATHRSVRTHPHKRDGCAEILDDEAAVGIAGDPGRVIGFAPPGLLEVDLPSQRTVRVEDDHLAPDDVHDQHFPRGGDRDVVRAEQFRVAAVCGLAADSFFSTLGVDPEQP